MAARVTFTNVCGRYPRLTAYPVTHGHKLIAPRRHAASVYELISGQESAVWDLVAEVRQRLLIGLKTDGFHIGLNDGRAAGQTIEHAHIHVIARRDGDVQDPRGGIRWVLTEKAKYWEQ